MNSTRKLLPLTRICSRFFSQTSVRLAEEKLSPFFHRLKENQKFYQIDNGIPVWLKAGARDKILYQISLWGCITGFIMSWVECFKIALST